MNARYHILVSGNVQGVGFRYTAKNLAYKYRLNGWVMNSPDGGVELDIEGDVRDLNDFVSGLKEEFGDYIKDLNIEKLPFDKEYKEFYIKF